ncbi:hypothetical protein DVH24_027420 [Malus domestica]|uniref:Uncharacterized protein n=1 Tax=Malus domestica TaxID=3750 RepID=A0A498H912_MALDO|nr:hypothetical protein DVH24_027420 [Malus domestica]
MRTVCVLKAKGFWNDLLQKNLSSFLGFVEKKLDRRLLDLGQSPLSKEVWEMISTRQVSSVAINSTAARTVDYLSKSRSRKVSEPLLVEVREPKRPRRVPFSAAIARRRSQPRTQSNINKFTPRSSSADELACPAITE